MISFEEAVKNILKDRRLNNNFRPGTKEDQKICFGQNTLVYYFGEKMFEIKEGKIIVPSGIFNITGERSKLDTKLGKNYFNKLFTYDGEDLLEKLQPYIIAKINSFTIHAKSNKDLEELDFKNVENLKENLKFTQDRENKKKYLVNIEGLQEACNADHTIKYNLSGIGNMRNPSIEREEYALNLANLDKDVLPNVIDWLGKIIILRAINIGGQKEKIFQEKLLSEYYKTINEAVKKYWANTNLFPLEEELKINRRKEEYTGRVDNLYIDINTNSVIFAEIKYEQGVIETKNKKTQNGKNENRPGLWKHAVDLQYFLSEERKKEALAKGKKTEKEDIEKELRDRLTMSNELKKQRVKDININKLKINDKKFIMICGYTEKTKERVINAIIRELKKFEKQVYLEELDMLLVTGLVDDILLDPLKITKDNGLREVCTFRIKTDKQSLENVETELKKIKRCK